MSTNDPWVPADPLGEALHFLRMTGAFYSRCEFTEPWGIELPPFEDSLMFHVMTTGRCWLEVEGDPAQALQAGDLALVPHGRGHKLHGAPGSRTAKLFDIPRQQLSERYELLRHGGGGAVTTLICGVVRFDHPAARRLVALLPKIIKVDSLDAPHAEWIQSTLRILAVEARELRPGGEAVITRLADILVVQAIRSWIARDPSTQTGWLGALRDRQIGRALALIHRDATRAWTVESLAAEIGMSRSAFAARFTELVGEPAMRYVARWRMQLAMTQIQEDAAPISALASRFGYESEAAFNRAFKRVIGRSPGAVRRDRPQAQAMHTPTS